MVLYSTFAELVGREGESNAEERVVLVIEGIFSKIPWDVPVGFDGVVGIITNAADVASKLIVL